MELKIIEESKNKLALEIIGEGHTFCNALCDELNEDKKVETASYRIKHPLISNPVITIETSGEDPKKVIANAAKSLSKELDKFQDAFKKAA